MHSAVAPCCSQEEKLRTAVEKDLPRMNKKLRELVAAWEEEHGETLRIGGATVPCVLKEQVSCAPAPRVVREGEALSCAGSDAALPPLGR